MLRSTAAVKACWRRPREVCVSLTQCRQVRPSSNTANTFTNTGDSDAEGAQYGVGYERRFGENVSLGVEYLITELTDDEYRVRAQGPAPATNPFILVNPQGTDFRRSDDRLDLDTLQLTLNIRF